MQKLPNGARLTVRWSQLGSPTTEGTHTVPELGKPRHDLLYIFRSLTLSLFHFKSVLFDAVIGYAASESSSKSTSCH